MRVNLIIAKRGRDAHLPLCLHYLDAACRAGGQDVELLLVEAGAALPELDAGAFPALRVRLLHRPDAPGAPFSRAALLNRGMAAMRPGWDWCGLVDVDMLYAPGALTAVGRAIGAGYVGLTGLGLSAEQSAEVGRRRPPFAEIAGWPAAPFSSVSQIAFTPGWLARYRELFGVAALFDERFAGWGHEDTVHDAGARLLAGAGLAGRAVVEGAWRHLHHARAERPAEAARNRELAAALIGAHEARLRAHLGGAGAPPLLAQAQALIARGAAAEAEALLRAALEREPDAPAAVQLLAVALIARGAAAEAEALLRAAVARRPADAAARLNLGEALRRQGRLAEAEAALEQAIALDPGLPEAHHNLGTLRRGQGRLAEAVARFREAVRLRPAYAAAHYNLGNSLRDLGEPERAAAAYAAALRARPGHAEAHLNLGAVLQGLRRAGPAERHYRRAAELRPELAAAHRNLFQLHTGQGQPEAARAAGARALALEPANAMLRLAVETALPPVAPSAAAIDAWRAELAATLARWAAAGGVPVDRARAVESAVAPLFGLIYHGRDDRPLRAAHAALFAPAFPDAPPRAAPGPPKVGFVVTEGHEGVFLKCMGGVLEGLPARELRPVVVCGGLRAAAQIRARIRRDDLEVLPLRGRLDEAAAAIRAAGFALLYYWEVGTDALNYLLPFCRLAPVQCAGWGWPVTSGMPAIDYFLSSAALEPPGAEAHYSERLVRLPALPACYARPPAGPAQRARHGLGDDDHLYLCTQNLRKLHPDFDPLLAAILRRDPRGQVVLFADRAPAVTAALLARLRAAMPDVAGRLRVLPQLPEADYMRLTAAADVLLDTPHYGGGANTCLDAAAAGAPMVTLPGPFHRGRWAQAVAAELGVDAGVAAGPADYVERALALANDRAHRAAVCARIRSGAGALFGRPEPAAQLAAFLLEACA